MHFELFLTYFDHFNFAYLFYKLQILKYLIKLAYKFWKSKKNTIMKNLTFLLLMLFSFSHVIGQRKTDQLDRGVVAINKGSNQLFISWRFLATDPDDISFNLYRQVGSSAAVKLNSFPITGATNYVWTISGTGLSVSSRVFVKPVINGVEGEEEGSWTLQANVAANRIVKDFNYAPLPAGYPKMIMKYCWVGDLDGDKKLDFVIDRLGSGTIDDEEYTGTTTAGVSPFVEAYTSEGTFLWRINIGTNVQLSSGHSDMVTVYDMDGDGKAEVMMAVSEGTTFADGTQIKNADGNIYDYTGKTGSAPQWVAIVNGQTGKLIHKVELPHFLTIATQRTDRWKDISGHFIIQHLDGIHPSLVYQYKNRQVSGLFTGAFAAWSFNGEVLVNQWATLIPKNDKQYEGHQIKAADIDGDGKDELVEISYAVDDDGTIMYYAPNVSHGDRHTLADIDPDRPGLEHFFIQQSNIMGMGIKDAATGDIIKGLYMSSVADVGRGIAGAFDPTMRGMQFWSTMNSYQMYDRKGKEITGALGDFPSEALWWGPGLSRYMASAIGDGGYNIAFTKYNTTSKRMERDLPNFYNEGGAYYLKSYGAGRAAFWGDILGDWREEMVLPRRDSTGFAVVSTWEVTSHKQYCLLQNPGYRSQTTAKGYYQTPEVDFYMAADMPKPPFAPVQTADVYLTTENLITPTVVNGKSAMIDIRNPNQNIAINENISPTRLLLMNPKGKNHILSGTGKITGETSIVKSMQGDVIINGNHDYTGITRVSEGRLFINGTIVSPVQLEARGVIGGNATLNGGITLEAGLNMYGSRIEPGNGASLGTLTIAGNLNLPGRNNLAFDVDQTKAEKSDKLIINGNFTLTGNNHTIVINAVTAIQAGELELINFTGTTNATVANFSVKGLEGVPYQLKIEANKVKIEMTQPRAAAKVNWQGNENQVWDFETRNFTKNGTPDIFVPGDTVIFSDNATRKTITINQTMPLNGLIFSNNSDYRISGQGVIGGTGGLTKTGTGKVSLITEDNTFAGGIDFSDGVLEVSSLKNGGVPSSIGASSSDRENWIMRNATLQTASQMATDRNLTVIGKLTVNNPASNNSVMISGNITGENISLELTGAGALNLQGVNNFTSVNVKNGTLALGSVEANSKALGTGTITLEGGTLQMRDANNTSTVGPFINTIDVPEGKSAQWNLPMRWNFNNKLTGKGTLTINIPYVRSEFQGDWSGFEGTLIVTGGSDGGEFRINNNFGYTKATFNLQANAKVFPLTTGRIIKLGGLTGIATAKLSGDNTHWMVGGNNSETLSYAGTITGSASRFTKEGQGTLVLSNANTYTGVTEVTGGTLWVTNSTGSATGTNSVTIKAGAKFGGTGMVTGNVSLNANSALALQNNSVGTLTVGGILNLMDGSTMTIDVNTDTRKCDMVTAAGKVNLVGNLEITNMGSSEYQNGMEFKIFNAPAGILNGFKQIISDLSHNMEWDTSRLISEGVLVVKAATATQMINAGKDIKTVEYYDVVGRRIRIEDYRSAPLISDIPRVIIEKSVYTDGSVWVEKKIK